MLCAFSLERVTGFVICRSGNFVIPGNVAHSTCQAGLN